MFIVLLMLFSIPDTYANETTIHGKIINYNEQANIILAFFPSENELKQANFVFEINKDGEFKANIIIEKPQVIQFIYWSI